MDLKVPQLSLVVLIGPSGSGKSTFAREHFLSTEVLSSDWCRGLVSDDDNDQSATGDAFDILHAIAAKRLARGRLTVVDATNVQREARKPLIQLARAHHVLPVAIVFDIPERVCHERNRDRPDRAFGPHVVRNQTAQLRRSFRRLRREGFRYVHVLKSVDEVSDVQIVRQRLWNDRRDEPGPFDIIGDVHGCFGELLTLLEQLDYRMEQEVESDGTRRFKVKPPEGRRAAFVGDLCDRGPDTPGVLGLVMDMVVDGVAVCVPGNHDVKLLKALRGRNVQVRHGLAESLDQLSRESPAFRTRVEEFLDGLVSHYVFDDGRLVVAHAGLKEHLQGRGSGKVREFALYGDTTGETDEFGLPVRHDWAAEYRGQATVVYGHTPVPEPEWLNNTINIDTGCVFGGALTALRYPERELVSVSAEATYAEPARPFGGTDRTALTQQQRLDEVLELGDVLGKRLIPTRLRGKVTVREENAAAALEIMSRFAVDPRWLIYLPPTMSPTATTREEGLLEYPTEAFAYYREEGVPRVVCQEKHMGSRAVVVVCRHEEAAKLHFGVSSGRTGVVYTRTGRPFFKDQALEAALLERLRSAAEAANLWAELNTSWLCLDAELMPWSFKAKELVRDQYAAVGAAASMSMHDALEALRRTPSAEEVFARFSARAAHIPAYIEAYRGYCWDVDGLADIKLAPFHLMATEGATYFTKDHAWHMGVLRQLCEADPEVLLATPNRVVDVTDAEACDAAAEWWSARTAEGSEGMVVKPLEFIARGRRGLVQPAVKVRGREYLRIIYGPEYTNAENLERLRNRGLGRKRSLALREFALGVEGLERFVRGEPLRRTHECVFGVLALESEPVDPRL